MQYCSNENTLNFVDFFFQFTDLPLSIYMGCYYPDNLQKTSMPSLLHYYLYSKPIDDFVKTLLIVPGLSDTHSYQGERDHKRKELQETMHQRTDKSFPITICMDATFILLQNYMTIKK